MESPGQACIRLVTALEALCEEEAACLRHSDFDNVIAIQARIGPIVLRLSTLASEAPNEAIRTRIAAVIERREEATKWLAAEIERTRERLNEIRGSQRRAAQVGPAYGSQKIVRSQLSARG